MPDRSALRTALGDLEILPVLDGLGLEVPGAVLDRPGVPDPWSCHRAELDAEGRLELVLGGFLVRTGDRVVLVDAGAGDVSGVRSPAGGRYDGGGFLASLRGWGVAPEDVTDVCLTHLHWDHIGWTSRDGGIVFPHATHRVHAADWEYFIDRGQAGPAVLTTLDPVREHLELITGDGPVAPGLDALHTPGHTPGSVSYVASGGGRRAIMLGDAVHSTVQLEERDWRMVYDVDPRAASAMRNHLADASVDTDDLVVGGHFPGLRFGRLVSLDGERHFRGGPR